MSSPTTNNLMNTSLVSEGDVAHYLLTHPGFFDRYSDVLMGIKLLSPHGARAVSLQERQLEILRDRIKLLERGHLDMVRNAYDNTALSEKILSWASTLLLNNDLDQLPQLIEKSLANQFAIAEVALRLWEVNPSFENNPCCQNVSAENKLFTNSLGDPFCGLNVGFDITNHLKEPDCAASIAFLPLRTPYGGKEAFGVIIFASPDEARFGGGLSVDHLRHISALAASSLVELRSHKGEDTSSLYETSKT